MTLHTATREILRFMRASQRLKNCAASVLIIAILGLFYSSIPYYQHYFAQYSVWQRQEIRYWDVLYAATLIYTLALIVYYLVEKAPQSSKSIAAIEALRRFIFAPVATWRSGLTAPERLGLLSVLLKGFFAPLMVVWLFDHSASLLLTGRVVLDQLNDPNTSLRVLIGADGYWFLFRLILFVDVFFFTLGYLIELPVLKNTIRSVDPTLLGWAVALACYPPFNGLTSSVFGWHSSDFPQFIDHPMIHMIANLSLLGLMAIYSWSSLALNFKASNLTHRGIVSHGPYRLIRHPAYVCKNLAWWIGLGPALIVGAQASWTETLLIIGSMLGWSTIYLMRALTEEDHLRSVDGHYADYCKKVKYRFIPYII